MVRLEADGGSGLPPGRVFGIVVPAVVAVVVVAAVVVGSGRDCFGSEPGSIGPERSVHFRSGGRVSAFAGRASACACAWGGSRTASTQQAATKRTKTSQAKASQLKPIDH